MRFSVVEVKVSRNARGDEAMLSDFLRATMIVGQGWRDGKELMISRTGEGLAESVIFLLKRILSCTTEPPYFNRFINVLSSSLRACFSRYDLKPSSRSAGIS